MPEEPFVHRFKWRELRVLLAVAQARGMGKVALALAISQPAVSR